MDAIQTLFQFLQSQSYIIIFFLMVAEGPVVTYLASFAASLGIFNIWAILGMSILGNTLPDLLFYFAGKYGKRTVVRGYVRDWIVTEKTKKIKEYFQQNVGTTLMLIKVTPHFPIPGLILAGALEVPFRKFLYYSVLISTGISFLFAALGYFLGSFFGSYVKYGEWIVGITVVSVIGIWLLLKYLSSKVANRIEEN